MTLEKFHHSTLCSIQRLPERTSSALAYLLLGALPGESMHPTQLYTPPCRKDSTPEGLTTFEDRLTTNVCQKLLIQVLVCCKDYWKIWSTFPARGNWWIDRVIFTNITQGLIPKLILFMVPRFFHYQPNTRGWLQQLCMEDPLPNVYFRFV